MKDFTTSLSLYYPDVLRLSSNHSVGSKYIYIYILSWGASGGWEFLSAEASCLFPWPCKVQTNMGRMSEDSEPLPNLRSIYDTPWVTGKEKKALTTMLGQSFCLIIYMLKNRDVLGLSAYLPSVYEGRCRHYRMVSKLCGMLVAE